MSFHPEKGLRSAEISGSDATIQQTRGTKLKEMCNKLPAYKLKIKIYVACCPQVQDSTKKYTNKQTLKHKIKQTQKQTKKTNKHTNTNKHINKETDAGKLGR